MLPEAATTPEQRYLLVTANFPDSALNALWFSVVDMMEGKSKGRAYFEFKGWKRAKNEIAEVSLYAYADIPLPKQFDIIFLASQPMGVTAVPFTITQAIVNAMAPYGEISHGHKHILVLRFEGSIPKVLKQLPNFKPDIQTKSERWLGLCHSADLPYIQAHLAGSGHESVLPSEE